MNESLRALYQQVILQHNARPQNFGTLPDATHAATQHNPLCGDIVTVQLHLSPAVDSTRPADAIIERLAFSGDSCALCRASASLMTQAVQGVRQAEVSALAAALRRLIATPTAAVSVDKAAVSADDTSTGLGPLVALQGARDFPSRQRCVLLPWDALLSALLAGPPSQ